MKAGDRVQYDDYPIDELIGVVQPFGTVAQWLEPYGGPDGRDVEHSTADQPWPDAIPVLWTHMNGHCHLTGRMAQWESVDSIKLVS